MNILSLFDGMSCGQLVIQELGITDYKYLASEIDKYAIKVAKQNFPNTIHIGDVKNVDKIMLERYLNGKPINLLIAGSPCQGFSFAGKGLNFDDPRSKLFYEFVRLVNETKPEFFLLENVVMKQEFQDIISNHLFNIQPIMINSSLMSAQNRERLYWVGELLPNGTYRMVDISQPFDEGITLQDILESVVDEKFYVGSNVYEKLENFYDENKTNILKNINPSGNGMNGNVYSIYNKSPTLTTNKGEGIKIYDDRESSLLVIKEANKNGFTTVFPGQCFDFNNYNSNTRRGRVMINKANCLIAQNHKYMYFDGKKIRRLTPIEYERLQTVPDGYTQGVSNAQRYKMLGNGWTVSVIVHILHQLKLKGAKLKIEKNHSYVNDLPRGQLLIF